MPKPSRSNARFAEHRRTEAARDHYAERERLFSAAVESSNDAIITKSLDGTITGWNPAAERLFGYTAAEAVGQHISLIVPPSRLPEVQDTVAPDRLGRADRAQRDRAAAQGRHAGRGLAQHLADQGAVGSRSSAYPRPLATLPNETAPSACAAPADRGAAAHLRNLAGSDPGDGLSRMPGSGQPELRDHPGIPAGGDDRSQRRGIHPPRRSRDYPRGNARGATRATSEDVRHARHPQGRARRMAVLAWHMVGAGQAILLRRSRHDREPASPGNIARERAIGARHHRYRARRLRPDRSAAASSATGMSQAETIFGWSREEALGTNIFELMGRKDGPGPLQAALQGLPALRTEPGGETSPRDPDQAAGRKGIHGRAERHRAEDARRLRVQRVHPRSHRQDRRRGADQAGRKDGSRRPAHRRHRA